MRSFTHIFTTALMLGALAACGGESSEEMDAAVEDAADVVREAVDEAETMTADATSDALLDINEATAEELRAVEGLGEAEVTALTAGRPFENMLAVDAILAGEGLDEAEREELYRHIWISIDLNEASEEEMLLIPGVGDRMAHEFDEYRPYEGMARFRAEIGKYVDEAEVARFERYVEIR